MTVPAFDPVVHAPHRLQLCALLAPADEAEFAVLRDAVGVSDSVLSKHLRTLEEAGYVVVRKRTLGGRVRDLTAPETAFVHRQALATVQYTATYAGGSPSTADSYVRGFRAAMVPHWGRHAYVNYADAAILDHRAAFFSGQVTVSGEQVPPSPTRAWQIPTGAQS